MDQWEAWYCLAWALAGVGVILWLVLPAYLPWKKPNELRPTVPDGRTGRVGGRPGHPRWRPSLRN